MPDVDLKIVADIISPATQKGSFGNFTETLDRILKTNRFNILSSETFDKLAKTQISNKKSPPLYWFSGSMIIFLSIIVPGVDWTFKGLGIIGGAGAIFQGWRIGQKPASEAYNKLAEGAYDEQIAQIIIDWATDLIATSKPLFQKLNNEEVKLSDKFRKAKNMVMVLLGDDRHRQALRFHKNIDETPFLYRTEDRDKIFVPLIRALAKTQRYAEYKHYFAPKNNPTKDEPPIEKEKAKSNPIPESSVSMDSKTNSKKIIQSATKAPNKIKPKVKQAPVSPVLKPPAGPKNKLEAKEARIESAKKRGTFFIKSKPRARDYRHLQLVQDRYDMLKLIIDYSKTDDYSEFVSNVVRDRWMLALEYIYVNWESWVIYRSNPHNALEFSRKLFGPELLDFKSPKKRKKFRHGKHREMSDLIIACFEIPTSEIINNNQLNLI